MTTGIGSLLATGYCVVAHDQSVGEALNIAAAATVLGMVSCIGGHSGHSGQHFVLPNLSSPCQVCQQCQQRVGQKRCYSLLGSALYRQ